MLIAPVVKLILIKAPYIALYALNKAYEIFPALTGGPDFFTQTPVNIFQRDLNEFKIITLFDNTVEGDRDHFFKAFYTEVAEVFDEAGFEYKAVDVTRQRVQHIGLGTGQSFFVGQPDSYAPSATASSVTSVRSSAAASAVNSAASGASSAVVSSVFRVL